MCDKETIEKEYRPGPVGALMDEYERAVDELKNIVKAIATDRFAKVVDPNTTDPDCRSLQTIVNHVVESGYGYAIYIRKQFGDSWVERKQPRDLTTPETACRQLDNMVAYTIKTLENKWGLTFDDVMDNKMKTSWGAVYNLEQLLEHAIVHVLRHRRQIEMFLIIIDR